VQRQSCLQLHLLWQVLLILLTRCAIFPKHRIAIGAGIICCLDNLLFLPLRQSFSATLWLTSLLPSSLFLHEEICLNPCNTNVDLCQQLSTKVDIRIAGFNFFRIIVDRKLIKETVIIICASCKGIKMWKLYSYTNKQMNLFFYIGNAPITSI